MAALQQTLTKSPAMTARVAELQKEIKALEAKIDTTLTLRETAKPRPTHIQKRGDFLETEAT
jgi:hypothetical protein